MGESLVEALPIQKKMGDSDAKLGVSVSFGRFGNDTLSWEKWSYFSQNKYLEEAGNLSTPGSVAKKKAYFEAHYKKKAAQKAMQLEQEKSVEQAGGSSDEPIIEGVLENSSGIEDKFVTCDDEKTEEEIGRETCRTLSTIDDEAEDNDSGSIRGEKQRDCADYLMDKTDLGQENEETVLEINKEELNGDGVVPQLNTREEANLRTIIETTPENKDSREKPTVSDNESSNSNTRDIARKVKTLSTNVMIDDEAKDNDSGSIRGAKQRACAADYLMGKTDLVEENKETVLEINKEELNGNGVVPELNTREEANLPTIIKTTPENKDSREKPTVSDNVSNSNFQDIARKATTTKRATDNIASPIIRTPQASTPRYSRPTSVDLTKSAPHVSKKKAKDSPLPKINNFRAEDSKSLIMGRMEDKDIVKPAFKTFQNCSNGSLSNEKCSSLKKASADTFELKISTFPTTRNENKGSRRSPPPDPENATGISPSIRLRSDERAEKRKEFLKNLKAKSITREVENAQRRAKSKEEKESEIKKLRQSLNFKAMPLPSFYRAREKGRSQKEGVDNNISGQPLVSNR